MQDIINQVTTSHKIGGPVTFQYNGKERQVAQVVKLTDKYFVGKLYQADFYATPEYRTFSFDKVGV